ncbi:uncharacterized protein METZ01_LOCUS221680 [marine metagenome]|uniref:Uncharacterized protein n=1 Tax=marine metagenome TaxID=408172 RepID=A0A382G0G5_9ZZZZ
MVSAPAPLHIAILRDMLRRRPEPVCFF